MAQKGFVAILRTNSKTSVHDSNMKRTYQEVSHADVGCGNDPAAATTTRHSAHLDRSSVIRDIKPGPLPGRMKQ